MRCTDEELDYATRFSCALGLAELQLEEGNQSAAAEVLKAIEPMAPKHNPAAALQYVQLLQRADCQVRSACGVETCVPGGWHGRDILSPAVCAAPAAS